MRIKDESKHEAIMQAAIQLVNEIGFIAASISKIARLAGVSPATIYVYYKNKEDLMVSTYVEIKKKLSQAMLRDFDESLPIRDIFRKFWYNSFDYIGQYPQYFQFTEQFSNSPFSDLVNKEEVEKSYERMMQVIEKGITQKIIKDVDFDILTTFMFYPIFTLSNKRLCQSFQKTEQNIEKAFTLAWDAIKL